MIDIHSHILPNLDDGAVDIRESLKMATMAVKDGIETIIATPHITKSISHQLIQDKIDELDNALTLADIPLEIKHGGEVPLHIAQSSPVITLCGSSYILLELPHKHVPATVHSDIYKLHSQGYQVVIAHPERNRDIIYNPQILEEILDTGALAQITAESITGIFGPQIQHCTHYLLRKNLVQFIASDCHATTSRKPLLRKAVKIAGKIIGKQKALELVTDNPRKIVQNVPWK